MKKKFGDDYRVVAAYESKALNWPGLKAEDSAALNRFSIFLTRYRNAMEGSKYLAKFEHPDTIQKLITKLPFNVSKTWRRLVNHIMETEKRSVTFQDLAEFVDNEAIVAANPVFGKITEDAKLKQELRGGRTNSGSDGSKKSFAAQVGGDQNLPPGEPPSGMTPSVGNVSWSFCNSGHALKTCEVLRRLPYQDRIQFLLSKHLWFGCLSTGHNARVCPERKMCTVANFGGEHLTILHTNRAGRNRSHDTPSASNSPREEPTREDSMQVSNGMANLASSKVAMAIVPIKVWSRTARTPVITHAFLGNSSTSTFCAKSLMKELGISGSRDQISLTTLEKKDSIIDYFVVKGLTISDLGENVFFELPAMYTRLEIPVSKEDIPTQSDVDRWPHLSGVYLPEVDAEIGLLIACDVPTVFDPLAVKHSKDDGPYAAGTSIGWVVKGPLGRHH